MGRVPGGRNEARLDLGVGRKGVGPLFEDARELGQVAQVVPELFEALFRRRLLACGRTVLRVEHVLLEAQVRPFARRTQERTPRSASNVRLAWPVTRWRRISWLDGVVHWRRPSPRTTSNASPSFFCFWYIEKRAL